MARPALCCDRMLPTLRDRTWHARSQLSLFSLFSLLCPSFISFFYLTPHLVRLCAPSAHLPPHPPFPHLFNLLPPYTLRRAGAPAPPLPFLSLCLSIVSRPFHPPSPPSPFPSSCQQVRACGILRAACCVLRVACCVLRVACCTLLRFRFFF